MQWRQGRDLPPSGFRKWSNGRAIHVRLHKDTRALIVKMRESTNQTMSSLIRVLLDKALGLESDPRDLASAYTTNDRNSSTAVAPINPVVPASPKEEDDGLEG
jgi:hypothetical protein